MIVFQNNVANLTKFPSLKFPSNSYTVCNTYDSWVETDLDLVTPSFIGLNLFTSWPSHCGNFSLLCVVGIWLSAWNMAFDMTIKTWWWLDVDSVCGWPIMNSCSSNVRKQLREIFNAKRDPALSRPLHMRPKCCTAVYTARWIIPNHLVFNSWEGHYV